MKCASHHVAGGTCFCVYCLFFFSSRRRHTRCALVTGVQTCALPIWSVRARCPSRGSRKRTVEHVSSNDVDESADHQAEEDRRGEPAHNLFYEMERSGGLPARRRFSVTATAQACEPRRA